MDMARRGTAKLFRNGRSQAVRLPKEFRFEGNEVRIKRVGRAVLLEPQAANTGRWFAQLDALGRNFPSRRARKQPATPKRKVFD
jgi:antitoxin VapB